MLTTAALSVSPRVSRTCRWLPAVLRCGSMKVIVRHPALAAGLTAFALGIAGCNGDERTRAENGANDTTPARLESLGEAWRLTRASVFEGARRDFGRAVEAPRGFASCFISRLGRRLTQDRVAELAAIHARDGE